MFNLIKTKTARAIYKTLAKFRLWPGIASHEADTAEFCRQCLLDRYGIDTRDLAGISNARDEQNGIYPSVFCEGCGLIQVDRDGNRLGKGQL